ncbi:hypothetical protein TL16_g09680 [Triparma laevis f. inornata]|uniref:Uncharacterized protein n=1 Tax=Triparma laevis f. inornata TaxID=1714386 RepID=A0A9W7B9K6_9STRA|nr:hypothetical protein TL16_g09680 [Triparma laevis f. inornata]
MGGGSSKSNKQSKKFSSTPACTVANFQSGSDTEKSTTVGGSKKLFLIIGDVKCPLKDPKRKISAFGRQTGMAVGCKIERRKLHPPLFSGYEAVPFEICDDTGTLRVEPNLKTNAVGTRTWFFPETHRENYITLDKNSFQVKSSQEVGGELKVRSDAITMFEKHGIEAKSWGKLSGYSERAEQIEEDKGWAASESTLKVGNKVAIIGTKFIKKKTYDVVLVPILMTTLPEICPGLKVAGKERSRSFSENDLKEKDDVETESIVCETERDE